MKFCHCGASMKRTIKDRIYYECHCGNKIKSESSDALIFEEIYVDVSNLEKFETIIKNSAYDIACTVVKKDCTCGRDYMKRVIVSDGMVSRYTCVCGNIA